MNLLRLSVLLLLLSGCVSPSPKMDAEVNISFSPSKRTAEIEVIDDINASSKSMKLLADVSSQQMGVELCGPGKVRRSWSNGGKPKVKVENKNVQSITLKIECL